jgi:hypothetical protein
MANSNFNKLLPRILMNTLSVLSLPFLWYYQYYISSIMLMFMMNVLIVLYYPTGKEYVMKYALCVGEKLLSLYMMFNKHQGFKLKNVYYYDSGDVKKTNNWKSFNGKMLYFIYELDGIEYVFLTNNMTEYYKLRLRYMNPWRKKTSNSNYPLEIVELGNIETVNRTVSLLKYLGPEHDFHYHIHKNWLELQMNNIYYYDFENENLIDPMSKIQELTFNFRNHEYKNLKEYIMEKVKIYM